MFVLLAPSPLLESELRATVRYPAGRANTPHRPTDAEAIVFVARPSTGVSGMNYPTDAF